MSEGGRQISPEETLIGRVIGFCIDNKLVVFLAALLIIGAGAYVAPFDWDIGMERSPVPVDAIPDLGENQQIVFTEWPGRSPQDIEDQITYPLTTVLLGLPDVKAIRSTSMFGFSSIHVIFKDFSAVERLIGGRDFYWTRSRILEKLGSLPPGTLPAGVQPALGPDATAMGQIFWYTLEGRDPAERPIGGWDGEELRTVQDWHVRPALRAAPGVSEVASVGGFVREYQVDVDPAAMRSFGVTLEQVYSAVRQSNIDVGAQTIELNNVEYVIRGVGFLKSLADIESSVVRVAHRVPVLVRHVARVTIGPQARRGALDKGGAEAVGGVVVARFGSNPLAVIKNTRGAIATLAPALPWKAVVDEGGATRDEVRSFADAHGFEAYAGGSLNQEGWRAYVGRHPPEHWPRWLTTSRVTIVPFYDRTGLIRETLGTLNEALYQQVLITIIVIVVMIAHLRSSILISSVMPFAVLGCFIFMRVFGVDANIVSLAGIAIAIGTLVDVGIVVCDNMLRHLDEAPREMPRARVIHRAAAEVGGAVTSAVASTIISFLPVFFMTGPEGKLFKPLAFTKTMALTASIVTALTILPPAAHILFAARLPGEGRSWILGAGIALAGLIVAGFGFWLPGIMLLILAAYFILEHRLPGRVRSIIPRLGNAAAVVVVGLLLASDWEPLGPHRGLGLNFLFVGGITALLLGGAIAFRRRYATILAWCLDHKAVFLSIPGAFLLVGLLVWQGFERVGGFLPRSIRSSRPAVALAHAFPGIGKEFMPPLDEGSFLFMPTTMAHASFGEALDILRTQDMAIGNIPEVDLVVGKIGRVESPLDPAPISMIETVIHYKPEYATDAKGRRIVFRYDRRMREFAQDSDGDLIPDRRGRPFRQWRDHIRGPADIWQEILDATAMPGVTSAPKLQPIAARLVMLQSGMRAAMGIKIKGPDLASIEQAGLDLERILKEIPTVAPATVFADRIIGKPHVEIVPDRGALARYGVPMEGFQRVVEAAIGGMQATTTVEGRTRFPVRIRYPRELRGHPQAFERILVQAADGAQIPLGALAEIRYARGPEMIRSEDASLVGYVLFDMRPGNAEVDVVEAARRLIEEKELRGEFVRPPGVAIEFVGTYQNQLHATRTLRIMVPLALFTIFLVLYFQFRAVTTTLMVFVGVLVAWAGAFVLVWLYGQPWFLDVGLLGVNLRELFQVHPVNLSVAVWVGFLALFGIADDDGIVMATYLDRRFREAPPTTIDGIRSATIEGGTRRIRGALMTTVTTILALLPILTSTGRGSDIMIPMAIPSVGGMTIEILTMLIVPVLYCAREEANLRRGGTGRVSPEV